MAERPGIGVRVLVVSLATCALTACGGTPSKADFVARMGESVESDFVEAFAGLGIPAAEGDQLLDAFVECQYRSLADDPDLLERAYARPGDPTLVPEIDSRAIDCITALDTGMKAAADPQLVTTTTTTTIPPVTVPSSLPTDPLPTDPLAADPLAPGAGLPGAGASIDTIAPGSDAISGGDPAEDSQNG